MRARFYWQAVPRWRFLLPGFLTLVVILFAWRLHVAGMEWRQLPFLAVLSGMLAPDAAVTLFVASAGGYLEVHRPWSVGLAALATTTVKRRGAWWHLNWRDGRRNRKLRLPAVPEVDALLSAAAAEVAVAGTDAPTEGRTVPLVMHIGLPATSPWFVWGGILFLFVCVAMSWATTPLWLLPWVALPYGSRREFKNVRYILTADGLWVVRRGGEQHHLIPATAITQVRGTKRRITVVTRDPTYPKLVMETAGLSRVALDWIERTKSNEASSPA